MASSPSTDSMKPLITLYRGFRETGKHVWSPFVVKVEARLRLAGVAYVADAGTTLNGPKGKIPYIALRDEDGASGADSAPSLIGDSTLIIKTLCERGILPDLNSRLTPEQKSHDLALRAMLEDRLYFFNGWEKWTQNYYTQRDHVLWPVPWPLRPLVGLLAYNKTMRTLHGQGTARFTPNEIAAFRAEIWATLAGLLQVSKTNKAASDGAAEDFAVFWALGGQEPTEADATLFGVIASVMVCESGPEARKDVNRHPILREYASRIHDKYFPDYEKW